MSLTYRGQADAQGPATPPIELKAALAKELPGQWLFRCADKEMDRRARERRERGEMPGWLGKDGVV